MMMHIYAAVRDGILNSRGLALISIRIPTYIVRAGLKGRKLAADADAYLASIKKNCPSVDQYFQSTAPIIYG